MKWRCEQCGKPHERNDPPCDNCGHHAYEKAVVPMAPEETGGPLVWVCTECGREHPRNSPPCSRCGNTTLEKQQQTVEDPLDGPEAAVYDDPGEEHPSAAEGSTTVWACTECGRGHPRNSPPCSRCGNMQFERETREFDDLQASSGGWVDALDRKYALGFLGAFLLLGAVLVSTFGLLGIGGPPTVDDVPGHADSVEGLSLSETEQAYVDELNDRRSDAGRSTLDRSDHLDRIARYNNQRVVKAAHGEGSVPSPDELEQKMEDVERCTYEITYTDYTVDFAGRGRPLSEFGSEEEFATALVDEYVSDHGFMDETNGFVGVDVHVGPDGRVFVTHFVC